jgi:hypothetical protein
VLTLAVLIAHAGAAVVGLLLARRRPQHRAACAFIVGTLAADLIRHALNAGPLDAPRPYSGAVRALFHVDQGLFLLWPFGSMGLVAVYFAHRTDRRSAARAVAGVYLSTVAVLSLGYPTIRGDALARVYAATFALALLVLVAGLISWTPRRARPRPEHAVTLALVLLTAALFVGPFLPSAPDPFTGWDTARAVFLILWSTVILMQGGSLWAGWWRVTSRRGSSR